MAVHHRLIGRAARLVWRVTKPRTIGVRAVLLEQHDLIALVRHTYTEAWSLPGGGVKKGESVEAALLQELKEEVAVVDPQIERVLGVYHSRREAKDDHIVNLPLARFQTLHVIFRRQDPMEVAEPRWFPLDQVPASTSAATARRIAEYRSGATELGAW
ncbi:NUDIX domain-containing protein [Novosphingobium sp. Rr 2-17]|uniref:NUDIX domain-containing protein n=1 Tax=Novosphingobium sp. Rr 2-17 TaxID=555793 RepID=UPI000A04C0CD|nr:NUDIX domain-containing protein [Novosphingobium sp. Rr 2-17]